MNHNFGNDSSSVYIPIDILKNSGNIHLKALVINLRYKQCKHWSKRWCFLVFNATFRQYFSYIMATSFSGGGRRREPPTMGKELVNFITCGCESSAPFFVFYKAVS